MEQIRFIELFAGIGGFRYGLERAGEYQCVWANEWDKYAAQIYRRRFGDKENPSGGYWHEPSKLYEGDIRAVDPASIPEHDLIVAGFPCQAFSIAGKREGFADTRGTLFYEICRILQVKRPSLLFLENVRGLLSHDGGRTFRTILQTLDEMGYDCQWQVLNSKNFGVPQNRERVFIIGHLRGQPRPQVFPIGETDQVYTEPDRQRQSDKAEVRVLHNIYGGFNETEPRVFEDYSPAIRTPKGGGHLPVVIDPLRMREEGKPRVYEDVSPCLNGRDYKEPRILGVPEVGDEQRSIRRLTPIECERLQGFPDGWTKDGLTKEGGQVGISDSQRYRCLGNAVTTNVINAIGGRLVEEM